MKNINKSHRKTFHTLYLILLSLFILGCKNKYEPEAAFIKVYHDEDINTNYYPLGIQETNDGGYIVLSAKNGWNIHILKTDPEGNMLWEQQISSKYVNAVPNLIKRNGKIYFVCMDAVGLFTYIMEINENSKEVIEFNKFESILYPLYVFDNNSEVYIQHYNRMSYETGIVELSAGMDEIQNSGSAQIFTDVEDKIVDHINYTGKRFPFFIRVTPEKNHLIFNGFNNYSFSAVFMNTNLGFSGVYSGAAFDGGLNAILPLGSNKFSLARFSFSNMFYNAHATLDPSTIDIAESIPAQVQTELNPQHPVLIKKIEINGQSYITYLASTKSNHLLLSFFKPGSSEPAAIQYVGESTPLIACDFGKTNDGGLMILTRVTVMGSFDRIATVKLSEQELEKLVE